MQFQSVLHTIHNRENPYVQLNKKALWDENLSLAASGLWARCMSRPKNWRFNLTELSRSCGINITTMRRYIKELIEHNYAVAIEVKDNLNMRFLGYHYAFFEFKVSEEEKDRFLESVQKMFPQAHFPRAAFPRLEKTRLLNNEEELKKEKRVKTNNPLPLSEKGKDCSVVKNKFLNQ